MNSEPPEGKGLATGLGVLLARILLIASGALVVVIGTLALIEQWPEPFWVLTLFIAGGLAGVWIGSFDSPAGAITAALTSLLPWR